MCCYSDHCYILCYSARFIYIAMGAIVAYLALWIYTKLLILKSHKRNISQQWFVVYVYCINGILVEFSSVVNKQGITV